MADGRKEEVLNAESGYIYRRQSILIMPDGAIASSRTVANYYNHFCGQMMTQYLAFHSRLCPLTVHIFCRRLLICIFHVRWDKLSLSMHGELKLSNLGDSWILNVKLAPQIIILFRQKGWHADMTLPYEYMAKAKLESEAKIYQG